MGTYRQPGAATLIDQRFSRIQQSKINYEKSISGMITEKYDAQTKLHKQLRAKASGTVSKMDDKISALKTPGISFDENMEISLSKEVDIIYNMEVMVGTGATEMELPDGDVIPISEKILAHRISKFSDEVVNIQYVNKYLNDNLDEFKDRYLNKDGTPNSILNSVPPGRISFMTDIFKYDGANIKTSFNQDGEAVLTWLNPNAKYTDEGELANKDDTYVLNAKEFRANTYDEDFIRYTGDVDTEIFKKQVSKIEELNSKQLGTALKRKGIMSARDFNEMMDYEKDDPEYVEKGSVSYVDNSAYNSTFESLEKNNDYDSTLNSTKMAGYWEDLLTNENLRREEERAKLSYSNLSTDDKKLLEDIKIEPTWKNTPEQRELARNLIREGILSKGKLPLLTNFTTIPKGSEKYRGNMYPGLFTD